MSLLAMNTLKMSGRSWVYCLKYQCPGFDRLLDDQIPLYLMKSDPLSPRLATIERQEADRRSDFYQIDEILSYLIWSFLTTNHLHLTFFFF